MCDADTFVEALDFAVIYFPVALYLGLGVAFASCFDTVGEWFRQLLPDGIDTVGDLLVWGILAMLQIAITPAALVYFFIRFLLRIKIRKEK